MKNTKLSKTRIATIVLAVLLVSSIFVVFANAEIYGADRTTNDLSARVDPITGMPYGDLSQYEWVSAGNGGENQRYSAGPAPNTATLKWSLNVGSSSMIPTAFNGLVFAGGGNGAGGIRVLNGTTGASVFNATLNGGFPGFGSNNDVVKFSDDLWGYLSTDGVVWYNFTIPDAGVAKTSEGKTPLSAAGAYGFTRIGTAGTAMYWGSMYDYESKTWVSVAVNSQDGKPVGVAFDCSDLRGQGAPIKWVVTLATGLEALGFGGGNAYIGGYAEGEIYAIDLNTGDIVWKQYKSGNAGYSITYYDGVVYHSASSTQITAFDGATGAILKTFDVAGGRAFFSYGGAAAYGMYFDSSIQIPQGWTSAWNAKTLEQLWKQPSEYTIKYLVGVVADGKFFTSTCDVGRGSALPGGASRSDGYRVTAFDVFTGQEIWNVATSGQVLTPAVAYGNLYMVWSNVLYCYSDTAYSADGTTGWPYYHGATYAMGTATGEYTSDLKTTTWDFQADSPITGSVVAAEGKVVVGSFAGTWYCVDSNLGTKLWTFPVEAKIYSTAAIVNGTVYTGSDDGYVYALNATTGEKIWERSVGGIKQGALQTSALQTNPSPVLYENKLLVGAQDGNLYCLNAKNGQIVWLRNIASVTQGIAGAVAIVPEDLSGRTTVLICANASVYQINFANGAVISRTALNRASATRDFCTPTVVYDSVFLNNSLVFINSGTGSNGYMTVFNATTMAQISQVRLSLGSGSTPTVTSPCYIPSLLVKIPNATNLGWGTGASAWIANQTTSYVTKQLPVVITIEAQEVAGWAMIARGSNLGGNGNANQWIVNGTSPYYFVRLWNNWVGHQSLASPVVALNAQSPGMNAVVYEGNSVYGFTAYNCSDGGILSTYTATAQVFATPALYNNRIFFADSAGYLHCIVNKVPEFAVPFAQIWASSNKGAEMFANEPLQIEGELTALQVFDTDLISPEPFSPPLPFAPVHLTVVTPDGQSQTISVDTAADGSFNFTFTPTQAGKTQWLVYFDGANTLDGQNMNSAYTAYTTVNVVDQTQPGPSETSTATPTTSGPAIEYIYAIVGVIVALIVIVAVVMLLRNRKK